MALRQIPRQSFNFVAATTSNNVTLIHNKNWAMYSGEVFETIIDIPGWTTANRTLTFEVDDPTSNNVAVVKISNLAANQTGANAVRQFNPYPISPGSIMILTLSGNAGGNHTAYVTAYYHTED